MPRRENCGAQKFSECREATSHEEKKHKEDFERKSSMLVETPSREKISGDEGEHWRTGSFAYAACNARGKPLGAKKVAACARKFLGETTKYNVDANNCHRFSTACHNNGNAEEVFRFLETFSIGKLVARICAFHKAKKIIWRPIKQMPKRLA